MISEIPPYDRLLALLLDLDGVQQDPRYHPEGDALYHSLQVFDLARRQSRDRDLWAAALLHDVGKAIESRDHDQTGADLLDGLVNQRVVFLVRHHLDLLRGPRAARQHFGPGPVLSDLSQLRRWDLSGRATDACVLSAEEALFLLLSDGSVLCP